MAPVTTAVAASGGSAASSDGEDLQFGSDSEASVEGGAGLPQRPGPATLASILGVAGLEALANAISTDGGLKNSADGSGEGNPIFTQVLKVIASLQFRLSESESVIGHLQSEADSLEEKRRLLARRAERAERERDAAVKRCKEAEAVAKTTRDEVAPVVERYMEAEVLRSQLQVSSEEVIRLRDDIASSRSEIAEMMPRLAEVEDAEAECAGAIAELEAAHTEEMAVLNSSHLEEVAEVKSQHSLRVAELENTRREEMAAVKARATEELGSLRTALDGARWQAEVYVREQQDLVREVCLRQRENARIAKRHGEARQEALELAVKLEALRAAENGAPAREAELQAVRHRYSLLQATAAEWQEALDRKRADCEAWKKRAIQRGHILGPDEDDAIDAGVTDFQAATPSTPPAAKVEVLPHSEVVISEVGTPIPASLHTPLASTPQVVLGEQLEPEATPATIPSSTVPPPLPGGASQRGHQPQRHASAGSLLRTPANTRSKQSSRSRGANAALSNGYPMHGRARSSSVERLEAPPPVLALPSHHLESAPPAQTPARDFLHAALRAALLHSSVDQEAIVEAENEVEMHAFLLSDADVREAELLLESEAMRRPPEVARKLRVQLAELSARKGFAVF